MMAHRQQRRLGRAEESHPNVERVPAQTGLAVSDPDEVSLRRVPQRGLYLCFRDLPLRRAGTHPEPLCLPPRRILHHQASAKLGVRRVVTCKCRVGLFHLLRRTNGVHHIRSLLSNRRIISVLLDH